MPGSLPVLNRRAVEFALKMALATGCHVAPESVFARKNYFYPDLPKGYQISQYELPLAEHGSLEIQVDGQRKKIGVTRIHMEEDAGKLVHSESRPVSFVDFNRTGVPLIEIVSEPDMRTRTRPWSTSRGCATSCFTWKSATATWKRVRSGATPTSRFVPRARLNSAPKPSSRT